MAIYWLIDGSYIYKSIKGIEKTKGKVALDYKKLKDKLEGDLNQIITAYYFNSTPNPPKDGQNAFHTWLKRVKNGPGIRVQLYSLKSMTVKCPNCGNVFKKTVQKGVDVGIATTALKFKDNYDTLILSTGDGDFEDTVQYLKEALNKKIILVGFSDNLSADIQQYSDEVWYIDEFFDEVKDTRFEDLEPFEDADKYIDIDS